MTVAYVGSKGTHLSLQRDINQLYPISSGQNPYPAGQAMRPDRQIPAIAPTAR
jgi:hypothetical protein